VVAEKWIDLLDPTAEELDRALPEEVHDRALEHLLAPTRHDDEPRPRLESHGDYVFGVFLVAVAVREEDRVYYQEVDLVLTRDRLVTVRKTPAGRESYDTTAARAACRADEPVGMVVYHLLDDIAERFLDLVDEVNAEIEELEDGVDQLPASTIRQRIADLRHDLLNIRRTLAPTRDAVRAVVDNRVDLDGDELFPHEVEINIGFVLDKLLRATDGLELSRDLVAGVRDFHQAEVANNQNEVMKRLAVIATVFLPLAFLTGFFGQNFTYLTTKVEIPTWTFWVLGVGLELGAAIGLFIMIKKRGWF
jgi:magnesium transporter